jgi:hypothetical protein
VAPRDQLKAAALVLLPALGMNVGYPQVFKTTNESAPIEF